MTTRTLIVVGGAVGADDGTEAPRRDYAVLAERLGADILQPDAGASAGRTRGGIALAHRAARRANQYDVIYCDSEHIGLPLAALLRGSGAPRLVVLAHYLTPLRKRLLLRLFGRRIDRLIVHTEPQAARARAAGFDPARVIVAPYQVDAAFWRRASSRPVCIASAGREFRDYLTLMRAVTGLSVEVRIAAGSHWSSRRSTFAPADIPSNVSVASRSYAELRDLYATAHFVVVPLLDVDFQAGIITILEAMSMGKAVIVSRTRGQTGVVSGALMRAGELQDIGEDAWPEPTGLYVPPRDAESMRAAIQYLLARPDLTRRMGAAGRAHVEARFSVERFAERLASIIEPGGRATRTMAEVS